ncbi:5'-nucleotidase [Apibacter raozihei]|uniref:5'-nucleotidase C-terminal domain-containing protein n=1 Tax=Apibacter TaxID=1778601 RepID=UPI000FE32CE8|nr:MULTISPECIES: 5'-nucleotidase [Apibacter]
MKVIRKLSLYTFFTLFLIGCKTSVTHEFHKTYLNSVIDDEIQENKELARKIEPYKHQIDSIMSQHVTYANEDYTKSGYSSNEGNLLADLILDYSKKYANKHNLSLPDFCLLNLGGVRTIIPKGEVTVGSVFEVAPFENEVVFVQMNGILMQEMFEYLQKEKVGHPLAGIKIVYNQNQTLVAEIAGKPFDKNKTYWVATNDYLMTGGDRMYFFTKSEHKIIPKIILRDALIEEMSTYKTLPNSNEIRLQFQN